MGRRMFSPCIFGCVWTLQMRKMQLHCTKLGMDVDASPDISLLCTHGSFQIPLLEIASLPTLLSSLCRLRRGHLGRNISVPRVNGDENLLLSISFFRIRLPTHFFITSISWRLSRATSVVKRLTVYGRMAASCWLFLLAKEKKKDLSEIAGVKASMLRTCGG